VVGVAVAVVPAGVVEVGWVVGIGPPLPVTMVSNITIMLPCSPVKSVTEGAVAFGFASVNYGRNWSITILGPDR